jgi:hypothetical protein
LPALDKIDKVDFAENIRQSRRLIYQIVPEALSI